MKDEKVISYWSDMYATPNVFGTGSTKLAQMAYNLIKDKSIKNILEIGCGQGRDAIFFAEQNYFVDTFDISDSAISFVNKTKESLNLENLNAISHDVTEPFPYADKSFDFVYSNLALQFFDIDTLEKIFHSIDRVMKDNSLILFSTKKSGDKYYNFGNKVNENAYEHKGITRYFYDQSVLEQSLKKKFEILGFDEDKHVNPNSTVSEWWKILLKKSR